MVLVCTSCNTKIPMHENYSKFYCPNCLEVEIIRCRACKNSCVEYVCPKCGFRGP
ncbi:MAG: zinc finger domain-containing protein [Candidatus Aenigmatarchaeota archaeon]